MVAFVIVDGKKIDLSDIATKSFDVICNDMVQAETKAYGSHIKIAAKLNDMLSFAWYDVDPKEVSDNAKALDVHKKPLYVALKKAGHSNPSVPFGRMRDYGRNLRAGLAPNGKTMADGSPLPNNVSEGDETGEGANPAKRSPMLRNVEELTALFKFNDKLGAECPAKVAKAQVKIIEALAELGIDPRTIK